MCLQRQRRQQRKADNDAERHNQQRSQILPLRPRLAERGQKNNGQRPRNCGAREGDEHRVKVHHRRARGWQRGAEDENADEAVDPAGGGPHSHSIVPGGLLVTSYTTRLIPRTSLMIRVATRPRNPISNG